MSDLTTTPAPPARPARRPVDERADIVGLFEALIKRARIDAQQRYSVEAAMFVRMLEREARV